MSAPLTPALRSPFVPALRGFAVSATTSLVQQALTVLRRFGTSAHIYLPGIGSISGLQASNFLLPDGSTGLSAVDGLVGLDLDAAGSVGVELVTNGTNLVATTGWTSGGSSTLSVNGGALRVTSTGASWAQATQTLTGLTIGATYVYSATLSAHSGIANCAVTATSAMADRIGISTLGVITTYFVAVGASQIIGVGINGLSANGAWDEWPNISVKQVTGIHATSTGAARPTLRQTSGKYSWEFAGAQYMALGSVPFQYTDDHFVVVVGKANGAQQGLASPLRISTTLRYASIASIAGNSMAAEWYDGTQYVPLTTPYVYGDVVVAAARRSGSALTLWTNGVQRGSGTAFATAVPSTGAVCEIGNSGIGSLNGSTGFSIFGKGTITDADLVTLMRFAAANFPNAPVF